MKRGRLVLLAAGIAFLVALPWAPAQSQTLYKCGKVYQDRPCETGKGRAIGSTGAAAAPVPPGAADAECAQRGKDSLKIVWSREGGATEERLVAEAAGAEQKRFVRDVYRRSGPASTVQTAVEADCMAEKKRQEEAAALAAAAAALRGSAPALASPPGSPEPASAKAPPPAQPAQDAEHKKRVCARYSAQMDDLRARERTGGPAQVMDQLAESRRRLRSQMGYAGC
jgi:hypothetical protein